MLNYYNDIELTEFSPVADILECLVNAVCELSDNEYIYADDPLCTNISVVNARKVIDQLRET